MIGAGERTRREALRRGLAAAAAAIAAGSIPSLISAENAPADSGDDASILEGAIAIEQTAVVAYASAYDSGWLSKPVADFVRLFREQEREHAEALSGALREVGGVVPSPPAPAELPGFGSVRNQEDFLGFAVRLENLAVAVYVDAQRKLLSPDLLRLATQIMSNEGQHLVVLRQALGAGPAASVPEAFEAGASPPPDLGGSAFVHGRR